MHIIQPPPLVYYQHGVMMLYHSESSQLRKAGRHLLAYVPYGYGDAAILLEL